MKIHLLLLTLMAILVFSCKKNNAISPTLNNPLSTIISTFVDKRDTLVGTYVGTTLTNDETITYSFNGSDWVDSISYSSGTKNDTIQIIKGSDNNISIITKLYRSSLFDTVNVTDTFKIVDQPINLLFFTSPGFYQTPGLGGFFVDSNDKTKFYLHIHWEIYGGRNYGSRDFKRDQISTLYFYKK